jgi:hypothetical protein
VNHKNVIPAKGTNNTIRVAVLDQDSYNAGVISSSLTRTMLSSKIIPVIIRIE